MTTEQTRTVQTTSSEDNIISGALAIAWLRKKKELSRYEVQANWDKVDELQALMDAIEKLQEKFDPMIGEIKSEPLTKDQKRMLRQLGRYEPYGSNE